MNSPSRSRASALGQLLALFDLERVAAATGRDGVRIRDLEPGLLNRVEEVDLGATQIRRAERVDDDRDAVRLELVVALLEAAVEAERVLETGAAAALDRNSQDVCLALGLTGLQLLDLRLPPPPSGRRGSLRARWWPWPDGSRAIPGHDAPGTTDFVTVVSRTVEPISPLARAALRPATFRVATRGGNRGARQLASVPHLRDLRRRHPRHDGHHVVPPLDETGREDARAAACRSSRACPSDRCPSSASRSAST